MVVAGGSGGVVVSVGRDNWEGRWVGRSERLGWLQVQVWVLAWNRVWVSSCAIVFGYDRRGGSEGRSLGAADKNSKHPAKE